jgi:predicted RNase H-like HicB family nuclease
MKRYTVTFERDEEGWWVATVRGVKGVHTQGRSIDDARRHVREALALAIGDEAAERAEFMDDVLLPPQARKLLAELHKAREREADAKAEARAIAARTVHALTRKMCLSRRDAAALTGYSFQRIHQLVHHGK